MNCAYGSLPLGTPTMLGGCQYFCETWGVSLKIILQSTKSSCMGNSSFNVVTRSFLLWPFIKVMSTASHFWKRTLEPRDSVVNKKKPEVLRAMNDFENACFCTSETMDGLQHHFWISQSPGRSLQSCQRGHDSRSVQRDRSRAHHFGHRRGYGLWGRQVPPRSSEHYPKHVQRLREKRRGAEWNHDAQSVTADRQCIATRKLWYSKDDRAMRAI